MSEKLPKAAYKEMEAIWQGLPKVQKLPPGYEGEYILYFANDPKYLYEVGFVDETKYSLKDWQEVFEECKQADGTYLISKEKFLNLTPYKFYGEIRKPVEVMDLREGWYDLEIWKKFCRETILPSTTVSLSVLEQAEKMWEKNGLIKDGQVKIDKTYKLRLKEFLENYPSTRRRREIAIQEAHEKTLREEAARLNKKEVQTNYVAGRKAGEKEKKNLKETLMKNSQLKSKTNTESQTVSLKDLRKKSKTSPKGF